MTAAGEITSYTYNPASELLGTDLGGALTTFGYDAAGNTVREVGPGVEVTYAWDAENRLVEVDGTCMNDCPDPCD